MTTELAIKYHDCFRRKIGEHDMVECRFCDQQGHNDVVGDYHGVKHRTNCPVVSALAARPQEQASQPTDDVKLLVPKQYQGNAYYHKGFEAGARWKALRSGTNSLADSLGDMLALFDDEGNFREDYQDQASVAIERAQENLDEFRQQASQPPEAQDRHWYEDQIAKAIEIGHQRGQQAMAEKARHALLSIAYSNQVDSARAVWDRCYGAVRSLAGASTTNTQPHQHTNACYAKRVTESGAKDEYLCCGLVAGAATTTSTQPHDGPCYEEGVLEGLEFAAKLVDRFKETELNLSPVAEEIRKLKGQVFQQENMTRDDLAIYGPACEVIEPFASQPPEAQSLARAYFHKAIDRVHEMRKLDLERANDPAQQKDREYYLSRAHRCDDILFWLDELEIRLPAGAATTTSTQGHVATIGGVSTVASGMARELADAVAPPREELRALVEELIDVSKSFWATPFEQKSKMLNVVKRLEAALAATPTQPPQDKAELLYEFIGYISAEYRWPQERWENCVKLAQRFLAATPTLRVQP